MLPNAACIPVATTKAFCRTSRSANQEIDLDRDEHVHGRGAKSPRLEPPLSDGGDGFCVETPRVQRPDDPDLRRASVSSDDGFQHNRALNSISECVTGVLGLRLFDQTWCGYCPARAVDATASAA